MRKTANGLRAPGVQPTAAGAASISASRSTTNGSSRSLPDALRGLRGAYGNAWSFEVVRHSAYGGKIEVVGQLRANGATVRETAVVSAPQGRSLGELLEQTANDSLRKCIETLMRNSN
jgi:hypothetical protein